MSRRQAKNRPPDFIERNFCPVNPSIILEKSMEIWPNLHNRARTLRDEDFEHLRREPEAPSKFQKGIYWQKGTEEESNQPTYTTILIAAI
ncbi:hypothetical protein Trydic_g16069 [Trypoxylus dichotomus]